MVATDSEGEKNILNLPPSLDPSQSATNAATFSGSIGGPACHLTLSVTLKTLHFLFIDKACCNSEYKNHI